MIPNPQYTCSICGQLPLCPNLYACGCLVCMQCRRERCDLHQCEYGPPLDLPFDMQGFLDTPARCPFCGTDSTLRDFNTHIQQCERGPTRCPHCQQQWTRAQLAGHLASCAQVPGSCSVCGEQVKQQLIGSHVDDLHPLCQFCGSRKQKMDGPEHLPRQCLLPACGEQVSECTLEQHLCQAEFAAVHFGIVKELYLEEREAASALMEQTRLQAELEQLQEQKFNVLGLKQQLRDITVSRDRVRLLNRGKLPDLEQAAAVLNVRERAQVAAALLRKAVQIPFKSHQGPQLAITGLVLPELVLFDKNFNAQLQYGSLDDLSKRPELLPYFKDIQNLIPQQIGMLSFAVLLKLYLTQKDDVLSETERCVQQIFSTISSFLLEHIQPDQKSIASFNSSIQIMFEVIFAELLEFTGEVNVSIDNCVNSKLLHYFAFGSADSLSILLSARAHIFYGQDIGQELSELVQVFSLPIQKFTCTDLRQLIFQTQLGQDTLNDYDYVFGSKEHFCLAARVFIRLCGWTPNSYAPRVLLVAPNKQTQLLEEIIPAHASILHVSAGGSLSELKIEGILQKTVNIMDMAIVSDYYDVNAEFQMGTLFEQLAQCQQLVSLRFTNQRFTEKAMLSFISLQKLKYLAYLQITDCEVCIPSYLKLCFPSLQQLILKLKALESRRKLFETDMYQLVLQLAECVALEYVEINLNNEFALTTKTATTLMQSCANLHRLIQLKLVKCQMRNEAFNQICTYMSNIPRLSSMSFSQNPIFSNDLAQLEISARLFAENWMKMPILQDLDLSDTRLNGKALDIIQFVINGRQQSDQVGLCNLKSLNLSKNRITDIDMKAVDRIMMKAVRLESLDITHCRDVSERGIRILRGRIGHGFRIGFDCTEEIIDKMAQLGFQLQNGVFVVVQ